MKTTITILFIWLVKLKITVLADDDDSLKVIYAVNAGGFEHTDKNGIQYDSDPLKVGTASDYGNHLLIIGRVPEHDEVLYRTERYHTSSFGYDLPLEGDGRYALVLKFCEVYFNEANMKIFDVILNNKHEVVTQLDIFAQVGRGTAHEEYVYFTVSRGKLLYNSEVSDIRNNLVRLDFIKGMHDNPKINAFVLFKGAVQRIPRLRPLNNEALNLNNDLNGLSVDSSIKKAHHISKSGSLEDIAIDTDDDLSYNLPTSEEENYDTIDSDDGDGDGDGENDEFRDIFANSEKLRKTSGPRQPDPYQSMDDTTVLLPVFIAIGAFIPLLVCLCKL